jgi:hypothetical protein
MTGIHLWYVTAPLQMGVTALESFHLHVRLNGKYYGKFAYVEELDKDTLRVRRVAGLLRCAKALAAARTSTGVADA